MTNSPTNLIPECGVHKGVPDATYHSWRLASKHALDKIESKTPMHLKHSWEQPDAPTPAMRFGTALHTLVLQPDQFDNQHRVTTKCAASTKTGKPCSYDGKYYDDAIGWLCGNHVTPAATELADSITEAQHAELIRMRDAIYNNKLASRVLNEPGDNEVSVVWDRLVQADGWTHTVRCKLRADAVRPRLSTVADVKTAECASRAAFERSILDLGYARQAAWYQDGFKAHGIQIDHFVFIVIEKTAPYGVHVFRLLEDAIEIGRKQNEQLIRRYAECDRTGQWPGYPEEVEDVAMPAWAMKRLEQSTL